MAYDGTRIVSGGGFAEQNENVFVWILPEGSHTKMEWTKSGALALATNADTLRRVDRIWLLDAQKGKCAIKNPILAVVVVRQHQTQLDTYTAFAVNTQTCAIVYETERAGKFSCVFFRN
jgi:hypothetical protein